MIPWPAAVLAAALCFLLGLAIGVGRPDKPVETGWRDLERVDAV